MARSFSPARIALALVAFGMVLWFFVASGAYSYMTGRLLLAALAVQPLGVVGTFLAGLRLSRLGGPQVGIWSAVKAQSLGVMFLYVLPSRLSEIVKLFYLTDRCGISASRATAAVIFERLADILVVAFALTLGASYLASESMRVIIPYWMGASAVIVVFTILLAARPQIISSMVSALPWKRLARAISIFLVDAAAILKPGTIFRTLGLGLLTWTMSYLSVFLFLWLAGSKALGAGDVLLVFLASTVGLTVGIVPAGLGTYEAAIVLALRLFGYEVGEGLALAIGMRIASTFLPLTIALTVLVRERIDVFVFIRSVRNLWRQTDHSGTGA